MVEEAGRLGCWAEGWAISPRRFVRTHRLYPQTYESIHGFMALQMTTVLSFETSGRKYPATRRNNPDDLLPQYENMFTTHKTFQHSVNSVSRAAFLTLHKVTFSFATFLFHFVSYSRL